MAQTAQAQVQDMIERASRLGDDVLASEIRAFAASRQFGLVFEHNRPERMRLYGKPVSVGDVVQVLPERGKAEEAVSKLLWRVDAITGTTAVLDAYKAQSYTENNEESRSARLEDLVAVAEYDQPIYAGLRKTGGVERGGNKPYQVVINGENYHALESLLFCYAGKVDCIYIDPPYNSGARDWKYNNDYVGKDDSYRHSKWLAFMERRLRLAKQLLRNDSVLIVAIDENEVHRLALLLEEIFPGAKMQMVSVLINPAGASIIDQFSRVDEQLLFIQFGSAQPLRTASDTTPGISTVAKADGTAKKFQWESLLRSGGNSRRQDTKAKFFPVFIDEAEKRIVGCGDHLPENLPIQESPLLPNGCIEQWPIKTDGSEACWQLSAPTFRKYLEEGRIRLGKKNKRTGRWGVSFLTKGHMAAIGRGELVVRGKDAAGSLIVENAEGKRISQKGKTIWTNVAYSATEYGSTLLRGVIPGRKFPFPKSLYAVEDALRYYLQDKQNALILDFFSGSGTTAHAVMRLNHQDGGNRQCICITNNEVSEAEENRLTKSGYRHGDPEWERLGICEYITKPRIEAAITGNTPESEPIKGDYKFTDEFPMADGFEENAIFFDLTYQNPDTVELGAAFEEIAPLLWLRAGARGSIIQHEESGYAIADAYAVLFDYSHVREFVPAVLSTPSLTCVFVVTDDSSRFASVKAELGNIECVRLYESYLRSFKIAAEDAAR